jgi:cytochrome c553
MKRALKWLGYLVGGLLAVILLALGTVYAITSYKMGRTHEASVPPVAIPTDAASLARGKHLVDAVGKCQACHGDDFSGKATFDAPVFASLTSSNLTSGKGGIGASYKDEDWVRSIRYGIGRDAKPLLFMPSEAFYNFNDRDLGSIIAYLKTLPPADQKIEPKRSIGPIARIISLVAGFPLTPADMIPRGTPRAKDVPEGVTAEYGKYLAMTGGCTSCHGANLSGGQKVDNVVTANLTPAGDLGKWTEADFTTALRTGRRPDGRVLSAVMPWPYMKGLTDDEIRAMWMYIHSLPAKETGKKD